MRWFRHVRRLTSHQRPAEYTEKTEISAIHDTRVANVQCVGVMSDGDRQHFPLQLWQNHRSPWQRRPRKGRSTTICRRYLARTASRRTSESDSLRRLLAMVDVCQAKSTPGVCRCQEMLHLLAVSVLKKIVWCPRCMKGTITVPKSKHTNWFICDPCWDGEPRVE
jgi:hypothetical protein